MANVPLNVKKAIRDIFDPEIKKLREKIHDAILEEFELTVDWEKVYSKSSGKYVGEKFVREVLLYFYRAVTEIHKKCGDDNLVGEALLEACTARRITFEIVDTLSAKRNPTTVFEQGVMCIKTTPEKFGENGDQCAANFEENFPGFGPKDEKFATRDVKAALPSRHEFTQVLANSSQFVILRLIRGSRGPDDKLMIDGPNELLNQLRDWIQRNIASNLNYREPAEIRFVQGLFQNELHIQSFGNNTLYNFGIASILQAIEGAGYELQQMQLQPNGGEIYILKSYSGRRF